MPPNYRARYSPSGPFMGESGELEGFVRRVFHAYNDGAVAVDEGDTDEMVTELTVTLTGADEPISDLSWGVFGSIRARVPQVGSEEPIAFPWALTLGCVTGAPATPLVLPNVGWPTSPDDYNIFNELNGHFVFAATTFGFQIGANTIRLGMSFYNAGGAHTAWVDTGYARLSVYELKGPPVIITTT